MGVVIMIALPIKVYAFLTMNKQGWLTRSADTVGGQGQDAASLRTRRGHGQKPAPVGAGAAGSPATARPATVPAQARLRELAGEAQ